MASQVTQLLSTGMKIIGGAEMPAYTLEHLEGSGAHPAGAKETIMVPYIELGRDSRCAVRFSSEARTVSRRHAAIVQDSEGTLLKNLSQTNPTLVNGKPVKGQWFLQPGDVIQLSVDGPRLQYQAGDEQIRKMGFTERVGVMSQQSLRPYRYYLWSFLFLFIALVGLGAYLAFSLSQQHGASQLRIAQLQELIQSDSTARAQRADTDAAQMAQLQSELERLQTESTEREAQLRAEVEQARKQQADLENRLNQGGVTSGASATAIDDGKVFFIQVEEIRVSHQGNKEVVRNEQGQKVAWSGTGFMLEDGKFVTARHVIQAWHFLDKSSGELLAVNLLEQLGARVEARFAAKAPDGTLLRFSSRDFRWDDSHDLNERITVKGKNYLIKRAVLPDPYDWAVWETRRPGSLPYNRSFSRQMPALQGIAILGYSYRLGASGGLQRQVTPLISESKTAKAGLENGIILLTDRNFGQGNSGGPAFTRINGRFEVIGIVSAGIGAEIGVLVPIANIR